MTAPILLLLAALVVYALAPGIRPSDCQPAAWLIVGLCVAAVICAMVGI